MRDVAIRQARADDIDAMVVLLQDLFGVEKDFSCHPSKQRQGLQLLLARQHDAQVYVAEHQGRVVAMCSLQKLVSTAEGAYVGLIEDVIVEPSFRGQGLGSALLAAMESCAQTRGLTRLQLLADRNNRSALNFYHGKKWHGTDLIGLRKRLSES